MLDPVFLKDLSPQQVGKYNHYNDKFMAKKPNAQARTAPANAPKIVIINRQPNIWKYLYWRSLLNLLSSLFQFRHQPVRPAHLHRQNNNEKPSLPIAIFFFAFLLYAAGIALAYGVVEAKKIMENLLARRKPLANLIKLFWAAFWGFPSTLIGKELGAYFGAALLGPTFGALTGGILAGLIGVSVGMLIGKYAAKAFTFIYTRFKTTNSDPYSLRPSVAKSIEKEFSKPFTAANRPNLMLGYLLNKIELAKRNNANPDWLKTLEGFRQDLKQGIYRKELKDYFDCEWATVRGDWLQEKQTTSDPRFTHTNLKDIERDLTALAVITSNIQILQKDRANLVQSQPNFFDGTTRRPSTTVHTQIPRPNTSRVNTNSPWPAYQPSQAEFPNHVNPTSYVPYSSPSAVPTRINTSVRHPLAPPSPAHPVVQPEHHSRLNPTTPQSPSHRPAQTNGGPKYPSLDEFKDTNASVPPAQTLYPSLSQFHNTSPVPPMATSPDLYPSHPEPSAPPLEDFPYPPTYLPSAAPPHIKTNTPTSAADLNKPYDPTVTYYRLD